MNKIIRHIKRWNIWRKRNINSKFYQFMVLLGFAHSPTLQIVWLPEEIAEFEAEMDLLYLD